MMMVTLEHAWERMEEEEESAAAGHVKTNRRMNDLSKDKQASRLGAKTVETTIVNRLNTIWTLENVVRQAVICFASSMVTKQTNRQTRQHARKHQRPVHRTSPPPNKWIKMVKKASKTLPEQASKQRRERVNFTGMADSILVAICLPSNYTYHLT